MAVDPKQIYRGAPTAPRSNQGPPPSPSNYMQAFATNPNQVASSLPPQSPQPTDTGNSGQANWNDPNWVALNLGLPGSTPGYNSNDKGSYERNYNASLSQLSPSQLLQRYSQGKTTQFGTDQDRSGYQAYNSFKSLLGRDPSAQELAQVLPAFQGPNGNINGNAALANLQQQYKANPTLDPTSQQNNQKPGDVSGSVNQQFQSVLGRAPTSDELSHFSQAIQSNQIDAYGLSSFLKQQPEYTNAQDQQFRSGLNTELQGYDTQEFNKEQGDVVSAYGHNGMAAGFDQNGKSLSPSLDFALTDLMGKIAQNRSSYLAQLSASQYGGNKDLAIGNYQGTLNQMNQNNQSQRANQTAYGQQLTNQGFQGGAYQQQMNDYLNYMGNNSGSKGANPLYGTIGGLVGAGIGGFATHSPQGAMAGYQIGSGAGNSYGYLNG